MTYRFMREGTIFFTVHGILQIPCYVLQRLDPLGSLWVGAAIFADLGFTFTFMIFMVHLRRVVCETEEQVMGQTVTTSAFAVCLEGLPTDATALEVREFCSQFGTVWRADV